MIRVVKLTFKEEHIRDFEDLFMLRKEKIRTVEGCTHLELWQDEEEANIFYTYSLWQNEIALLHYRNSSFFRETWYHTRQMFSAKAEAWSLNQVEIVP